MRRSRAIIIAGAVLASTAAWAFPWDIDMSDSPAWKAYEWPMMQLPAGVVARPGIDDIHSVRRTDVAVGSPEAKALQNPYAADADILPQGKHIFEVYCQACHGVNGGGNAPVSQTSAITGGPRFIIPPPALTGDGGRASGRTDGEIYSTIRHGKATMPPYSWALTEKEMWAAIAYLRTLPGGAYVPPKSE